MARNSFFEAPIATGLPVADQDILAAKQLFKELGRLTEPPRGFSARFDQPLQDAITNFQRERGLTADGVITPGGPTERNIHRDRGVLPTEPPFRLAELDISAPVGNGLPNQPEDIIGVSKALGRLGLMNFDKTREPSTTISTRLVDGLKKIQEQLGVAITGDLKPGDKAHQALKAAVERKSETASDIPRGRQAGSLQDPVQAAQLGGAASPSQPAEGPTNRRRSVGESQAPPPVPAYRKEVFKTQPGEWESWDRNTRALPNVGGNEAHVYREIFAAEGGFRLDPRTKNVLAGITPRTFTALTEPLREVGVGTKGGPRAVAKRKFPAIYRVLFDIELKRVGGSKAFERFRNKNIAAAIGDVLFNHGGPDGTKIIQSTINRVSPNKVKLDSIFGSTTLQVLLDLDAEATTQRKLLNAITLQRKAATPKKNEWRRFDHFLFGGK